MTEIITAPHAKHYEYGSEKQPAAAGGQQRQFQFADSSLGDLRKATAVKSSGAQHFELVDNQSSDTKGQGAETKKAAQDAAPDGGNHGQPKTEDVSAQIEKAKKQLDDAKTPQEKEAALGAFQKIVTDSDQRYAKVEGSAQAAIDDRITEENAKRSAAGMPLIPSFHDAFADTKAGKSALDKAGKALTPEQDRKVEPLFRQWAMGSPEQQKEAEAQIRALGYGKDFADALHQLSESKKKYADTFKLAKPMEDDVKSKYGQEGAKAQEERIKSREALMEAQFATGHFGDWMKTRQEKERIREELTMFDKD